VPLRIADSDDRILTIERTKVSARAGLQRSGVPLQTADSDYRILTIERTKVSARAGLQQSRMPLQIADSETFERTKVAPCSTKSYVVLQSRAL
jgi:hypothetical protein